MSFSRWVLHRRIQVYMMDEEEECSDFLDAVAVKLAIVSASAELDTRVSSDDESLRTLRSSIPSLQNLIYAGKWSKSVTVELDNALACADRLHKRVLPFYINLVQITIGEKL